MRIPSLVLGLTLVAAGCGSAEKPTPDPATEAAPEAAPAEATEAAPEPATPAWKILAPSPLELEAQVTEAGISKSMADLVPTEVPEGVDNPNHDRAALQTGVVFAYALLGGRTSEKEVFLAQVKAMRTGMETIGTGKGLLNTMDRSIEAIENDAAAREDFLKELDAQVSSSVPEEGWGPDDTTGPLLQAGAWLAGMNVVAQAVVRADDAEAADALLDRGEVAAFFLKYIQSEEGSGKAGGASKAVAEGLKKLQDVSERETIGVDGAREVVKITEDLLKLF